MPETQNTQIGISRDARDILARISSEHGSRMVDFLSSLVVYVATLPADNRAKFIAKGEFIASMYAVDKSILTEKGLDEKKVSALMASLLG